MPETAVFPKMDDPYVSFKFAQAPKHVKLDVSSNLFCGEQLCDHHHSRDDDNMRRHAGQAL